MLLSSGNYNYAATGVPWFKSSLFFLLLLLQKIQAIPTLETQTASSAHFLQTAQYSINNAPTIPWLMSRPHIPVTTEQVRPELLPTAYSNTPYSALLSHDLPPYWIIHTIAILPPSYTDDGTTYCPPWLLPNVLSVLPAFRHSVDLRLGNFWPTNPDQSGHLQCLTIWLIRHISQVSYCSYHIRLWPPLQYHTLFSYCVTPPASMTEDKNLLLTAIKHIIAECGS